VRILKRVLGLILVVALVAVIAVSGLLVWVTVRAMPQTTGTVHAAGLAASVTVARDAAGIAHVTADTPHDLFFAQGYVHASERMWQMEVWRHISAGRLAELFGASQLDTDKFIRTLGLRIAAQRDLDAMAAPARAVLDAYTAGVNAWLDGHRGSLGLAFLVAGDTPEPWTDLDTVAWGKVQAWNLGGNFDTEVFRYLADARLGDPARTDQLFPAYREGAPVITPAGLPGSGGAGNPGKTGRIGGGTSPATAATRDATPPLAPAEAAAWHAIATLGQGLLQTAGLDAADGLASDHGIGSNEWVVGPAMSASRGALLANDPHLGISMPSIWYMNGLHCRTVSAACPYDVAGVSFPGVPGVVLGHNARIAWGATNIDPDVQDLVIEKVDPADPDAYLQKGVSTPFETRHEHIKVSGAAPVDLEIRSTVHGPILNGVDDRLADAPPMAIRWTASLEPDHTLEAILGLNTAADFEDFRSALSLYGAPAQNFVYADVDGHIGYQFPGYVPIRSNPKDRGDRPVRGDDGSGEWTGRIPYDDLPWQLDPVDGLIVTANNAAVDAKYPHLVAQEWDPGYRAERILDLIAQDGADGLTVAEVGQIQFDGSPLAARDVVQFLEPTTKTADGATLATRIADWDGVCDEASLGCTAFNAWEYRVLRDIFDDDLGPLARDYVGSPFSWVVLQQLIDDPTSAWWDDTATTGVTETADDIIGRAMDEAGAQLRAAVGDPAGWTWGRLHTATFQEATLGTSGIRPLEWYFNDGPHPVGGTAGAIDNTYFRFSSAYPDPEDETYVPVGIDHVFDVTNLPSYRLTIDMSDLDGARIVITTGQSGNPFDRHYADQVEPWRTGQTVGLPFTTAAIAAATVSSLTLTP
jgi:penicillin amidase